ncbi:MAG: flagellar hook-length control protein FliK [Planctomycetota bacterium]
MNANILTIDRSFVAPGGKAWAPPKADAKHTEKPFFPVADNKSPKVDSAQTGATEQTGATDNVPMDTRKAIGDKPTREFCQVLREKTGTDSSPKAQNDGESKEHSSKEQGAVSGLTEPEQLVKMWLAENSIPVPQSQDAAAATVEPKAGCEPGQLIADLKPEMSPPVTGHAVKSAQIKALATTEKGQLGLKTILPETSNGQNGLKAVSPEESTIASAAQAQPGANGRTDKIVVLGGAAVDTKALNNKADVKEMVPEASADAGGKTAVANKKLQGADASADSDATGATATNAKKDLVSNAFADGDGKKVSADGGKAPLSTALPSTAADLAEKQSQAAPTDQGKDVPNPRAGIRQPQAESSDANGRESVGGGSDTANARGFAKSSMTEVQVQVSDGQDKNRDGSAAGRGSTQNIEQILSHSNPHVPTASQSATPAANAKPANLPGQSSHADVSADIGKQILGSIQGSPSQQGAERQITVRLNPPELGHVFIKLQEHEAGLTGILEVSRSQTRFEIERALPEIIRNLADCGIQVRRFDVVLSEQGRSEQEAFGGQSMPNNGRYEHNPADQGAWANEADLGALSEWSPNNYSYQNLSELQESLMTDGSINMLI